MKTIEIRELSADQISDELIKYKREQLNLRFQRSSGQLDNTARVKEVRRTIAKLKTIQNEKINYRRRNMPKRILSGVVENNSQDKTVVVRVERRFIDPLLKKTVRRSKKYHAHDEENKHNIGDEVRIQESKPYSKLKKWIVI